MKSATFSLDPPPGFRPFDPHAPVTLYHRRLPHWRQEGATYFVTFRLADSLPAEKLAQLESLKRDWANDLATRRRDKDESDAENKAAWEELSRNAFATVEHWLDLGMGHCLLREEVMRMRVKAALVHGEGDSAEVGAAVVMPNHVHLVVRPSGKESLETYLQRRKRHSAREINRICGRGGSLWQEESFDRIVRDADHLWRCLQYIGRNPRKAGLPDHEFTRWLHPVWVEKGWSFIDDEL